MTTCEREGTAAGGDPTDMTCGGPELGETHERTNRDDSIQCIISIAMYYKEGVLLNV
jgi:hypothetical protein